MRRPSPTDGRGLGGRAQDEAGPAGRTRPSEGARAAAGDDAERCCGRAPTPKPFDRRRPLALMHIPKCAGTALDQAIVRSLRPRRIARRLGGVLYGDFDDFGSFDAGVRDWMALSPEDLPTDARYVAGHLGFKMIAARVPRAQIVTVLREPYARVLSHWLFWRSFTREHIALWGSYAPCLRLGRRPLAAFLGAPRIAAQTDNVMVRMLLHPHPRIPGNRFIDPRDDDGLAAEALATLDGLALVGLTEDPALARRFEAYLGRPLDLRVENELQGLPPDRRGVLADELTGRALDLLAARSRLDLRLWQVHASRLIGTAPDLRARAVTRAVSRFAALLAGRS